MSAVLVIVVLALAVAALYPLVRESVRRRRQSAPAYVEALRLLTDGRDREAVPLLKEAVNAEPDNIDAWVRLGDAYIRLGEPARGIKVHENLGFRRNLRPEDERQVLAALARDYERTDRKLKAIATLEELARGRDRDAVERLVRLYLETGSAEKCRDLLRALEKGESDRGWLAGLLVEYARGIAGREPDEALAAFREALRLDPHTRSGRLYYGDLLFQRGELEAAARTWQELLDLEPRGGAAVRRRLERAYYELGRYDEVTRTYERLLRKAPDDAGLAVALALIHRKKGNYDDAARLLAGAVAGRPDTLGSVTLALLELDRGNDAAAGHILDELATRLQQEGAPVPGAEAPGASPADSR